MAGRGRANDLQYPNTRREYKELKRFICRVRVFGRAWELGKLKGKHQLSIN